MSQILSILAYGEFEQTSAMVKRNMDQKTRKLDVLAVMVALNIFTYDSDTKLYIGPQILRDMFALGKSD